MIVSITGGNGFIGRNLVRRHLQMGDTVRVLTRSLRKNLPPQKNSATFFEGDLINKSGNIREFVHGTDILYHCAGELHNEKLMYPLHVDGTRHLLSLARGTIGHWVQLGSVGSYGPQQSGVVTETTPTSPVGPYETSKTLSDELVAEAARKSAFPCIILRPSNVYGPGMTNQSLFQLISTIQHRLFFFIGKPGASANYIHIDNVVNALVQCGHTPSPGTRLFNVSDHRSLEDFVSTLAGFLGIRPPALRIPLPLARFIAASLGTIPGFPLSTTRVNALTTRAIYSTDAIRKDLGYSLGVSMENGLEQMVNVWKRQRREGTA